MDDDAAHKHEGSFAAGQELIEHHPERPGEKADFAAGEELQEHTHQSTFAEGQEQADPHPELLENRGGFAAGQRKLTGIRPGKQGLPSFLARNGAPTNRSSESTNSTGLLAHWRIEVDVHEKHSGAEIPDAMASGVPGRDEEGPEAMASNAPGPEGPDAMASSGPGPARRDAMASGVPGRDEEGPESMATRIPGPEGPDAMASGA
jgi:hypothetical protein